MTTPPLDLPPLPPSLAARFSVEARLGAGGFGAVLRCRDQRTGATIALKLLRLEDADSRARFAREARATASLVHPGLVDVRDHGATPEGHPWIAYEFVEGSSLADRMTSGAPLRSAEVRRLGRVLADAVGALHRAGLIHRDLKPDNVLLRRDGSPVLCDLGLARRLDPTAATVHTLEGMVLGTPAYMAPEALRGQPATPATDTFSLAATLAHAWWRTLPWGAGELREVLRSLASGRPLRAPSGARREDPGLARALERALDLDPARRPPLEQLARELARPEVQDPAATRVHAPARVDPVGATPTRPRTGAPSRRAVQLAGSTRRRRRAHPARLALLSTLAALGVGWLLAQRAGTPAAPLAAPLAAAPAEVAAPGAAAAPAPPPSPGVRPAPAALLDARAALETLVHVPDPAEDVSRWEQLVRSRTVAFQVLADGAIAPRLEAYLHALAAWVNPGGGAAAQPPLAEVEPLARELEAMGQNLVARFGMLARGGTPRRKRDALAALLTQRRVVENVKQALLELGPPEARAGPARLLVGLALTSGFAPRRISAWASAAAAYLDQAAPSSRVAGPQARALTRALADAALVAAERAVAPCDALAAWSRVLSRAFEAAGDPTSAGLDLGWRSGLMTGLTVASTCDAGEGDEGWSLVELAARGLGPRDGEDQDRAALTRTHDQVWRKVEQALRGRGGPLAGTRDAGLRRVRALLASLRQAASPRPEVPDSALWAARRISLADQRVAEALTPGQPSWLAFVRFSRPGLRDRVEALAERDLALALRALFFATLDGLAVSMDRLESGASILVHGDPVAIQLVDLLTRPAHHDWEEGWGTVPEVSSHLEHLRKHAEAGRTLLAGSIEDLCEALATEFSDDPGAQDLGLALGRRISPDLIPAGLAPSLDRFRQRAEGAP